MHAYVRAAAMRYTPESAGTSDGCVRAFSVPHAASYLPVYLGRTLECTRRTPKRFGPSENSPRCI
jgi:hypothetical protein